MLPNLVLRLLPYAEAANWMTEVKEHLIMVMSVIAQGMATKPFLRDISGVRQYTQLSS
jgi:hypothetical protein